MLGSGAVFCGDCGRPLAGRVCIDCPHARVRLEGNEDPIVLSNPLDWPELTPRGRAILRGLCKVPAIAESHGRDPDRLRAILIAGVILR